MLVRYDIRPDSHGWTIYDRGTDLPVEVEGYVPRGLDHEDAEEIVDLLNTLDLLKRGTSVH
jgi:hypothetical protein